MGAPIEVQNKSHAKQKFARLPNERWLKCLPPRLAVLADTLRAVRVSSRLDEVFAKGKFLADASSSLAWFGGRRDVIKTLLFFCRHRSFKTGGGLFILP